MQAFSWLKNVFQVCPQHIYLCFLINFSFLQIIREILNFVIVTILIDYFSFFLTPLFFFIFILLQLHKARCDRYYSHIIFCFEYMVVTLIHWLWTLYMLMILAVIINKNIIYGIFCYFFDKLSWKKSLWLKYGMDAVVAAIIW